MRLFRILLNLYLLFILSLSANAAITQGTFAGLTPHSWAYPTLANDNAGNTYLLVKEESTVIELWKFNGTAWSHVVDITPALVNADANVSSVSTFGGDFDITTDANNHIHVALSHYKGSGVSSTRGVMYGYYNGTTWDFEVLVEYSHPSGWLNTGDPKIVVDNGNNPHVVYEYRDSEDPREYALRHTYLNGTWTAHTDIFSWSGIANSGINELFVRNLYINSNDLYFYYAYDDNANTSPNIYYNVFNNTTDSWTGNTFLFDGVTNGDWYTILGRYIEGSDTYFAYSRETATNTTYFKINAGAATALANKAGRLDYPYDMETDGNGNYYMLVWSYEDPNTYFYMRGYDGTSWTNCDDVAQLNAYASKDETAYTVRPDGKVIVIYSDYVTSAPWGDAGWTVGEIADFMPPACFTPQGAVQPPTLAATTAASSIATTTASSGGNVTADDGDAVTARGVCWNTTGTPTTADSKTTDGTGTGVFTSSLTGLTANTTYYVRAYATNGGGTGYGAEVSFTTLAIVPNAPTVNNPAITTLDVTLDVNGNNAATTFAIQETSTGDYVQANGSLAASAVWQDNATWGTVTVTGLTRATEYTFQVKARNTDNVETAFGATQAATTLQDSPTLASTTAASAITANSASSGGNISDDGGSAITARGVCWNLGGAPTTADDKTTDGTGAGIFTSSITGLSPATTYYVRAYATNGIGTSYGNEISFTTLNLSVAISNVNKNSDIEYAVTADITNPSSIPITGKGFVWSIAQNPTIASNSGSTANGTGSTSYTDNATVTVGIGILCQSLYYDSRRHLLL